MNDNNLDELELARLGIERVGTEAFIWDGVRFSNPREAIAAAKKARKG